MAMECTLRKLISENDSLWDTEYFQGIPDILQGTLGDLRAISEIMAIIGRYTDKGKPSQPASCTWV